MTRALEHIFIVFAALIGAAFAIVCLVFKPVETLATSPISIPGATKPAASVTANDSDVLYTPGSRDRTKGATWVRKRTALLTATPGVLTLNEDELNTWFAASMHTRSARRAGVSATATQLDFHIASRLFQIAAPVAVDTPLGTRTLIAQMRGDFKRAAANPETGMPSVIMFAPREAYIGSLPLHRIPGATDYLLDTLLETQTPPADALAAWRKIQRITISDTRELQITISATATSAE